MPGYIALIGFAGLAAFIVLLYVRRRRIESGMTNFYKELSLYRTTNEPPFVRASLGASDNLYCCRAKLTAAADASVEFCWWEWYLTSNTMINGMPSTSFANYLAFSFAPNSVCDDFIKKVLRWADKSADSAAQKVKDFFVTDMQNPYRAEILADGSLIICWRVLKRRDVYEAKVEWLKINVSPPIEPEIISPEKFKGATLGESDIPETAAPDESKILKVDFYKHDSYAMLRRKFSSVWTNLGVELHHLSAKFQHEGYDEFDSDAIFGDPNSLNEIAFALTDETIARTARRLFSENYDGAADILRDGFAVEDNESLKYCNNPFRLPFNEFTYGEFKRRFVIRWTNLSIELFDASLHGGVGSPRSAGEFADDFEMKNLKHADKAFLHDYIYISTWGESLKKIQIAAAIKNNKFGVYCEGNLINAKLKDFNEAENLETLRRFSSY